MVRRTVIVLLNMILLSIPASLSESNQRQTSVRRTLDIRIGHGIVPNLSPKVGPAMMSENSVKMKDLFNFDLLTGEVKLPNTWDSLPKFRYPYYDTQGRGYLLYG